MTMYLLGALSAYDLSTNMYTTFQHFNSNDATCKQKDLMGTTVTLLDVCQDQIEFSMKDGNITVKTYLDGNCTGRVKTEAAPINTCAIWSFNSPPDCIFSSPEPFSQACSVLSYPVRGLYLDSKCTVLATGEGSTGCSVTSNSTSTNLLCDSTAAAVSCIYTNTNCQGQGKCDPIDSDHTTGDCFKSDNTNMWKKITCPTAANANPICPASNSKKSTKKPTGLSKGAAGAIGGVITVVIVVPLVIIISFIVTRRMRRRGKFGMMKDEKKDNTNYGTI